MNKSKFKFTIDLQTNDNNLKQLILYPLIILVTILCRPAKSDDDFDVR